MNGRRVARWEVLILACILTAHLAALVHLAWRTGVTVDEPSHLVSSYFYWHGKDELKPRDMPPLIKIVGGWVPRLMGLPIPYDHKQVWDSHHEWLISLEMMDRLRSRIPKVFFLSRLPLLIFPISIGVLLWWWARRVFSPGVALILLCAFALEPTALGHGALFKNDLAATFGYFLFWYCAWVYWRDPRARNAAWLGVAIMLAVLAKLSMLILLGFGVAIILARQLTLSPKRLRPMALGLTMVMLIPYLGALAACQFDTRRLSDWELRDLDRDARISDTFLAAANVFRVLPLPEPLWDGTVSLMQSNGDDSSIYFLGRVHENGHWLYFLAALALKVPIPLQLLLVGSLLLEAHSVWRREFDPRRLFWIATPWIYIGLASTSSLQLGVRLVLPALPLALLTCGGAVEWLLRGRRAWVLAGLFALLTARAVWIYPHCISFFNLWPGTPERGARLLSDSNVDWGQDLREMATIVRGMGIRKLYLSYFGTDGVWAFFDDQTTELLAPPWSDEFGPSPVLHPQPGYHAISVTLLTGHMFEERFRNYYSAFWNLKPIARAGYSMYLYKVEPPQTGPSGR